MLQAVLQRCDEAGGRFATTIADLAVSLGVESGNLRTLLQQWRKTGAIQTRPNGRMGLLIGLPGALVTRPPRARTQRRPVASPSKQTKSKQTNGAFCPMCGHPVRQEWRFCYRCGQPLPGAQIPVRP